MESDRRPWLPDVTTTIHSCVVGVASSAVAKSVATAYGSGTRHASHAQLPLLGPLPGVHYINSMYPRPPTPTWSRNGLLEARDVLLHSSAPWCCCFRAHSRAHQPQTRTARSGIQGNHLVYPALLLCRELRRFSRSLIGDPASIVPRFVTF